jgi:hypothetical protein
MNIQLRTAILWILIIICYFIHGYYHLSELFYGVDIKIPGATGEVPLSSHLFSLLIEILPLSMAVATLFIVKNWFAWANFILAILFGLLNAVHLAETVMGESSDIRQIALLSLVIVINILLISDTNKQRKRITTNH